MGTDVNKMRGMQLPEGVLIKENSLLALLAVRKLKSKSVAIVFGSTIHLYGIDSQLFLQNRPWVKHELKHIDQYREHGYVNFLFKYVVEWMRKGYHNNKFEIEARMAERES
jgi:hypothetical protein